MKNNFLRTRWSWLIPAGAVACWLVCGGEFLTEYLFGRAMPGYDSWRQSVSFLGQVGSPVQRWVAVWGVAFSVLYTLFSQGFRLAFAGQGREAVAASWLMLLYGLGEGIGSGCFPVNHAYGDYVGQNLLHNVFGGIGDAALFAVPLALTGLFRRTGQRGWRRWSWATPILGLLLMTFFLGAKFLAPQQGLLLYKGLWQRLFLLVYYAYLISLSVLMLQRRRTPR